MDLNEALGDVLPSSFCVLFRVKEFAFSRELMDFQNSIFEFDSGEVQFPHQKIEPRCRGVGKWGSSQAWLALFHSGPSSAFLSVGKKCFYSEGANSETETNQFPLDPAPAPDLLSIVPQPPVVLDTIPIRVRQEDKRRATPFSVWFQ